MILLTENYATPVHQTVALSGKRKFCWEALAIGYRKHDTLADRALRDCGSLAVGALRNACTRGKFLLTNDQIRREHSMVSTKHDLGIWCIFVDIRDQAAVDGLLANGQPRREHNMLSTTHVSVSAECKAGDVCLLLLVPVHQTSDYQDRSEFSWRWGNGEN